MTGEESKPLGWMLVKGKVQIRAGETLASLSMDSAQAGYGRTSALLARLARFRPLDDRPEHAWAHAHICDQKIQRIVSDPSFGFGTDDVRTIMSSYQAGLIAGLDGLSFSFDDRMHAPFSRDELRDVSAMGFRHGDAIRQWWASYTALVTAYFDGRSV